MAANITNIHVFDAASYERDSNDEVQDSGGSNDLWPYVLKAERHERLGEPLRFVFTVVGGCEWNTDYLIKSRHRVYVEYSDSSVIPCRVTRVKFDANSGNMTVEAVHLWADLSERKFIYIREPDYVATLQFPLARITVDDALSLVFDDDYGIPSIFTKGTVDASVSSKLIALNSKGYSHNQLLQEICKQAACEFEVTYSDGNPGTVTFNFDETIGTQTSPENRLIQNNRFKLDVDDAQEGYFSRIIPFASGDGEDVSMSDGWLYVDSGTENGPGTNYEWVLKGNPFFEDDMYTDGSYFLELYTASDPDEIRTDLVIGDVDASTSTLTTTSIGSGSVSPDDVIKLRIHSTKASALTGSGSRTSWVNDSTSEASKGIVEEARFYDDVSGYDNLFEVIADGSGDMSDGSTDGTGNYIPDGMNLVQGDIRATVNSITAGTSTIKLDGDHTDYLSSLETVVLTGTDDNDGTYSVSGSPSFSAGETTVVFVESLPGTDQGSAGGLATYTGLAVSSSVSSAQYINVGDASMKVVADANHQVRTDAISITATQEEPYLSVWCTIGIESGRVAMWIERDEDGYRDIEPKVYEGKDLRAISLGNSAPVEIGTTKDVRVYWEALEDDTVFHIDALAVTQHKGVGEVPFRQYMGAAGLMERAGIDMIKEGGTLSPQYVSELFDDQTNEVHLGCTVTIKDLPDGTGSFAIDATPRVIELRAVESINGRPMKQVKVARERKRLDKRLSFIGGDGVRVSSSKPQKAPDTARVIAARNLADAAETSMTDGSIKIINDPVFGGTFRYNPEGYSSQQDEGITFATGDGRLIERVYDGPVQLKWWNVVGDGTTDYSAEFRLAMTAAVGSVLEVGEGEYLFNDIQSHATFFDHIFEPPSNTDIRFDQGAIIAGDKTIGSDANGYALFRIQDGKENISISGGVFDGEDSSTNKGMGAVVAVSRESGMDACSNLRFSGMTMKNLRQGGISVQSVASQSLPIIQNITISDNIISDVNGHGLGLRGCYDLAIHSNHIKNCVNTSFSTLGIDSSGGHYRAVVTGNTIEGCGGGIKVESDPLNSLQSYQAVVVANAITDCSQVYGIRVSSDYAVISGNTVRNAEAQGIDLAASNNQRAVISDNIIVGIADNTGGSDPTTDGGHAVRIVNRYNSTTVERDRVIVANNVFEDCDGPLELRSSGVTIQGNKFRDFKAGQSAIRVSNGLSPDTLYDKLLIDGNSFDGFTTTVIYLQDDSGGTDGSDDVTITNNQIHGTGFALVNAENVTGLVVSGNVGHVTGSGSHGIYVVDSDDVTISCNSLKALGSGTGRCVHLNGCDNVSVVGNTTESNDENIYLTGCDYFSVIGNVCNGGTYAVRVLGTTTTGVTRFNQDNGSTNGVAFDSNCNIVDGFYGLEVSQASAISKLTDSTGGSTDGTLSAISGSGDDSNINNNFAEVNAKISAIIDAMGASSGVGITAD